MMLARRGRLRKKSSLCFAISWTLRSLVVFVVSIPAALSWSAGVGFIRTCPSVDIGDWKFGQAPNACAAEAFGNVTRMKALYNELVFDRRQGDSPEAIRNYVSSMYSVIKQVAETEIRRRVPGVTEVETASFVRAVMAAALQETYWSHYRISVDGKTKFMVGDHGVSHGMMQVNQRYFASREEDRSFDLVEHVGFATDLLLENWIRAAQVWCVKSDPKLSQEKRYERMARESYSIYNGGPAASCRWARRGAAWGKNDVGYFDKLSSQIWLNWVKDPLQKSPLNYECLRAGKDLCAIESQQISNYLNGEVLLTKDGQACVFEDNQTLVCASSERMLLCQKTLSAEAPSRIAIDINDSKLSSFRRRIITDRNADCEQRFPGVAHLGDFVHIRKQTAARWSSTGAIAIQLPPGTIAQILDIERSLFANEFFYKIKIRSGREVWVSSQSENLQTLQTLSGDLAKVGQPPIDLRIPIVGSTVTTALARGAHLLVSPDSNASVAGTLLPRESLVVRERKILGESNQIWLRSDRGWIFAGQTHPSLTVDNWIRILPGSLSN